MTARCAILATIVPGFEPRGALMRCPSNMMVFHYHATTVTGRAPCKHKHMSVTAALACYSRNTK